MEIISQCGSRKYKIKLDKRVSVITGVSGDGKTTFIDDVRYILKNNGNKVINSQCKIDWSRDFIYSDTKLYLPSSSLEIEHLSKEGDYLFIIDENFPGMRKRFTSDLISISNIKFLIVTRNTNLANLTIGLNSIYKMDFKSNEYITIAEYYENKSVPTGCNAIVISEDSTEGKMLFDIYTKDLPVIPSNGKYNIVNTVMEADESHSIDYVLLPVDCCAIGSIYIPIEKEIYDMGIIPILNGEYLSFERLLLDAFEVYHRYDEYSFQLEEKFYEKCVNEVLDTLYGIPYIKGTVPSLLLLENVYKSFRKYFYFIPESYIRGYNEVLIRLRDFIKSDTRLYHMLTAEDMNIENISNYNNSQFIILDIMIDLFINKKLSCKTSRFNNSHNTEDIRKLLYDNKFYIKEIIRGDTRLHKIVDNQEINADDFIKKFS